MNSSKITIQPYEDRFAQDFARLNIEWLEQYFYVEEYDKQVFADPEGHILHKGGFIFMALIGEEPVGTVALIKRDEGVYELSKMGVTVPPISEERLPLSRTRFRYVSSLP